MAANAGDRSNNSRDGRRQVIKQLDGALTNGREVFSGNEAGFPLRFCGKTGVIRAADVRLDVTTQTLKLSTVNPLNPSQ